MTHSDTSGFHALGLDPRILAALDKEGIATPTPIQHQSIPALMKGEDVIGIAQTGTGKTFAFGLPMMEQALFHEGLGLVVAPTRELALQIEESLVRIGRSLGLRTAALIGGMAMGPQLSALRRGPHIVVTTPGRLIDHIEQKTIRLNGVTTLVLDEADRMLDMGFLPQIERILREVPKERQTMLFSATMPADIARIAARNMKMPVTIEVARAGTSSENVEQEVYIVSRMDKGRLLEKLLAEVKGTILVFSRTKHGARKITTAVQAMGHTAAELHSNRSLAQRREALEGFKKGKYRVLIATDIAARGIDVTGIELVINYDLPENSEDYVHRIGRTGRAGLAGRAVSFAMPDQLRDVKSIERLIRKTLKLLAAPSDLPPVRASEYSPREERGERGGFGRGARGGAGRGGKGGQQRGGGRFERAERSAPSRYVPSTPASREGRPSAAPVRNFESSGNGAFAPEGGKPARRRGNRGGVKLRARREKSMGFDQKPYQGQRQVLSKGPAAPAANAAPYSPGKVSGLDEYLQMMEGIK